MQGPAGTAAAGAAAVFKRCNIVEEQDLKAAVRVLNRTRKAAGSAKAQSGHEMDTVDQK